MSHQGPDLLELWNNHCGFFMWLALALISHTKLGSLISGYEKRSYPQGRICFCQWDGEIKGKRVTFVAPGLGEFFFIFSLLSSVCPAL